MKMRLSSFVMLRRRALLYIVMTFCSIKVYSPGGQRKPLVFTRGLAEKERFELSRRESPAYTLSRGASSANLSTSPCRTVIFNCHKEWRRE